MDDPIKEVRVRFAPSPTGHFHLGGARTALFNWLFARHENGKFLIRIEDTDKERSQKIYETEILESLKWLGLYWDEEVVHQSERTELYRSYLQNLLDKGLAYYCFCTPEELEIERQSQLAQGLAPKYSGRCRNLSLEEVEKKLKNKEKAVIRFKMPSMVVSFHDLIRGKISYDTSLIGDIIIAKSLEQPLYNFAVVIDDFDMKITHVIRGEEHISNTPKQIMIQRALNFPSVRYAHLPLILGPDKKKLSKRYLVKSILDYKKEGYLPEAILNFLVLLGWHPIKDREVIRINEMINEFTLERVHKKGAIFNPEKLDWLNSFYIRNSETKDLVEYLKPFLKKEWLEKEEMIEKIVEIDKTRLKKLADFPEMIKFFFELPEYPTELLLWKGAPKGVILSNLKEVKTIMEKKEGEEVLKEIKNLAEKIGRGEVLWPLRVALSGQESSPDPLDIIKILGKKESLRRVEKAIIKLSEF